MAGGCLISALVLTLAVLCIPAAEGGRRGVPVPTYTLEVLVELTQARGWSQAQALAGGANRVGLRSLQRYLERFRTLGHVRQYARTGKAFGWSKDEQHAISLYLKDNPDTYLNELVVVIAGLIGRAVTIQGVWWLLKRMGITNKRLSKTARARCEIARAAYVQHMVAQGYVAEQLVFFDETGTNTRGFHRTMGYALRSVPLRSLSFLSRPRSDPPAPPNTCNHRLCLRRSLAAAEPWLATCVGSPPDGLLAHSGERAEKILPLIRGVRFNMLAAISCEGLCTVEVYTSSTNLDGVLHFMINHLLCDCWQGGPMNAYPGARSVLVLDNASIHHADHCLLRALCATHGVVVEFLPPYSPDLNPIKEFFSGCKHRIRREWERLSESADVPGDLKEIFAAEGSVENAQGWIRHAGY